MFPDHLKFSGPGFLFLLMLSLLIGCQAENNDLAAVQDDPTVVTAGEAAQTPTHVEEAAPPTVSASPTAKVEPTSKQAGTATLIPTETSEPAPIPTETGQDTPATMGEPGANADVEFVRAVQQADGSWTFHVTVRHPDSGWEDYANGWDVVTPDGLVLKRAESDPFTRLLLHPHETEQPFTRSQSGLLIPEGISQVTVRAHDLVDGFGGRQVIVDLALGQGPDFEVERP